MKEKEEIDEDKRLISSWLKFWKNVISEDEAKDANSASINIQKFDENGNLVK